MTNNLYELLLFIAKFCSSLILIPILFSQSFDWELSNRQPFEIPNTYLFVGTGYFSLLSNDNLSVPVDNAQTLFGKFNGSAFNINIGVEYWLDEKMSISPIVHFSKSKIDFNQVTNYPIYNGEMLKLDNLYYLNIDSV